MILALFAFLFGGSFLISWYWWMTLASAGNLLAFVMVPVVTLNICSFWLLLEDAWAAVTNGIRRDE